MSEVRNMRREHRYDYLPVNWNSKTENGDSMEIIILDQIVLPTYSVS